MKLKLMLGKFLILQLKLQYYQSYNYGDDSCEIVYVSEGSNYNGMEEKIIEFMHENPFMYDTNNVDYKKIKLKEKKWRQLASELNVEEKEVKRKWKTLKDSFYREDTKRNLPSGSGTAKSAGTWKYYDNLLFLKTTKKNRSTHTNMEDDMYENYDEQYEDFNEDISCGQSPSVFCTVEELSRDGTSNKEDSSSSERPRKRTRLDKELLIKDAQSQLGKIVEAFENKCTAPSKIKSFFDSVAETVEEANLPIERFIILQKEILECVESEIIITKEC